MSFPVIKNLQKTIAFVAVTVALLYFCVSSIIFPKVLMYRTKNSNTRYEINWCKQLHRRTKSLPYPIALASYPGSGNTWLRYLLQQATGIVTGSIYLDYALRSNGFPAENISDGSVLLVKTHGVPNNLGKFKSAVLLIRNPRDAILAEFNRLNGGHKGHAPKSAFMNPFLRRIVWAPYVSLQLRDWEYFHNLWLTKFPGPVYIVFYEALLSDTKNTLQGILSFLNISVTEDDMDCTISNKEGIYKRKKKYKDFDPFTRDMYRQIDIVRTRVYAKIIKSTKLTYLLKM